ncbi:MAG TPA: penicillin-binding transpeptidase domain-containing protein [Kineosporiaceae bacterium]|nr:penicillin-binding transpeptidase domain-containing protein [Kineosporiaceae bacterium]
MNGPLRRLAAVVVVLFAALFASSTFVQFADADSLNKRPGNARTLYKEYSRQRGPIVIAGQEVARSVASQDRYQYRRTYPGGPMYSPVTGFYSVVYGETGLEDAENGLLAGTADQLFYRRISDLLTGRRPEGATVELTIDPKLQKIAWDALGDQRGAVVALDPKTGNILAMVSKPSYDANSLAGHDAKKVTAARQALLNDPTRPLDNRAIAGRLYPPGSTFKLITAAAALSSGKYTDQSVVEGPAELALPQTSVKLKNDDDRPCGAGAKVNLVDALRISCNTAFASVGMAVGQDALREEAQKFGFGQPLSVPLTVTPSIFPATLTPPQVAQSAIGQFDVRVSPLQIAMVSAAIANGGTLMKPNLVARVRSADLEVIFTTTPTQLSQPISRSVADQLRTMMLAVVTNGTGTKAQIDGVDVAGKTGTAQSAPGQPPHAWFTSFASGNGRDIAVAVVVEDGGRVGDEAFGGTVAAPIARAVMEAVVR